MPNHDPHAATGALWPLGIPVSQSWREIGASLFAIQEFGIGSYLEIGVHRGGLASLLIARTLTTPLTYDGIEIDAAQLHPALADLVAYAPRAEIAIGDVIASSWLADTLAGAARPALVLCDGGDKPRELALVAPLLRPGDYVLVHDYGSEVCDADLPTSLTRLTPPWLAVCAMALLWRPI